MGYSPRRKRSLAPHPRLPSEGHKLFPSGVAFQLGEVGGGGTMTRQVPPLIHLFTKSGGGCRISLEKVLFTKIRKRERGGANDQNCFSKGVW